MDVYDDLLKDPAFLGRMKKALPGVDVNVIGLDEYQPDIPDSFIRHLNAKQKELRAKLLAE